MTQAFQIGDIVRSKKADKRYVITSAYCSLYGNIIYEGYEYDAPDIPPGTTRHDLPWALAPDMSTYAEHLVLEVPSPWRRVQVDGQPIPMVGELTNDPNERTPSCTVSTILWNFSAIYVNGYTFTSGTVPAPEFTTF